ncbi:bleomycin resistance protein [Schumannella soli]|uniref:Bleomycin resistance protein n=1 Tax=Schumannella soli TaxID=2590779 RepID=A0A506Y3W3_9MICO|nr:VOC family protein [Schumannella soli]TPW77266.1 VOC family protein [Schumannella soli]
MPPDLVPELIVESTPASLAFWVGLCGFRIEYERPDEGFAYLSRGSAHVMLDQRGVGRDWMTGALERPFGRGVNFQIGVTDLDPILSALRAAEHPLFLEPETKWYRVDDRREVGVRQFLVEDPDGYLLRFQTSLGHRDAAPAASADAAAVLGRAEKPSAPDPA